jgi:hypothetical protein
MQFTNDPEHDHLAKEKMLQYLFALLCCIEHLQFMLSAMSPATSAPMIQYFTNAPPNLDRDLHKTPYDVLEFCSNRSPPSPALTLAEPSHETAHGVAVQI